MADIAVTASLVGRLDPQKDEVISMIAAAALTAGQLVYQDTAGKAAVADGSAAGTAQVRGVALTGAGAGQAVTVLRRGGVSGFTISQAYDARVYLSDTAGAAADAAGTVPAVIGRVFGSTDKDVTKYIYVDIDNTSQWS